MKKIPNLLTFGNLSLGILAMLSSIEFSYTNSALFIMIAALLDRYDGRLAKRINATSDFGKELDSLADMVTFGAAPALLIFNKSYSAGLSNYCVAITVCVLLYVICGCYRLAKYNITEFDGCYRGMPITVAGFLLATYSLFTPLNGQTVMISILVQVLLAYLMISSFKFPKI